MRIASDCIFCEKDSSPVIHTSKHWLLTLARDQSLLGQSILVLQRHLASITDLSQSEWDDLKQQIALSSKAIGHAFRPTRFDFSFQKDDTANIGIGHVHLHVLPRYSSQRLFQGVIFEDRGYPGQYFHRKSDNLRGIRRGIQSEILNKITGLISESPEG